MSHRCIFAKFSIYTLHRKYAEPHFCNTRAEKWRRRTGRVRMIANSNSSSRFSRLFPEPAHTQPAFLFPVQANEKRLRERIRPAPGYVARNYPRRAKYTAKHFIVGVEASGFRNAEKPSCVGKNPEENLRE